MFDFNQRLPRTLPTLKVTQELLGTIAPKLWKLRTLIMETRSLRIFAKVCLKFPLNVVN